LVIKREQVPLAASNKSVYYHTTTSSAVVRNGAYADEHHQEKLNKSNPSPIADTIFSFPCQTVVYSFTGTGQSR